MNTPPFNSIPEILEDLRNGKMIILMDCESRENEGDLIVAGQFVTPEHISFMMNHGKGLICIAISSSIATRLELPLQPKRSSSQDQLASPAFTVSIEASSGVGSGISALDRCRTIQVAVSPDSTANDIDTPGHVFPIIARDGGLEERQGHTEASVTLMKMAGLAEGAVLCEILKENGETANRDEVLSFGQKYGLKVADINELCALVIKK